jgi:hypothetical protein
MRSIDNRLTKRQRMKSDGGELAVPLRNFNDVIAEIKDVETYGSILSTLKNILANC